MGLGSIVSGLINSGRDLPTADLSALFSTIANAGADQRRMINDLPESLKPLYEQYKASNAASGQTLQDSTTKIGQNLLDQTRANYDPNSAAMQATLAALRQQDYSTLPGNIDALKANLASSGGLNNGGAVRAITQATLAPAAQYSQQAANSLGNQLQNQQQNVQSAINRISQLDDATAQTLFGMTTNQAQAILTSGREDLKNKLTELINQSDRQTGQTLSVQGLQANNAYQNALLRNQQKNSITNDITGTAFGPIDAQLQGINNDLSQGASGWTGKIFGGGGNETYSPQNGNIDVTSDGYQRNSAKNAPQKGGGSNAGAFLSALI